MLFSSCNKDKEDVNNTVKAVFIVDPATALICTPEDVEARVAELKAREETYTIYVDGEHIATIVAADIISLTPDSEKFPTFTASIGNADFKTFTVTVTQTTTDTTFSVQFPITLLANTTTNVDYSLETSKAFLHENAMYGLWIPPYQVKQEKDSIVLRFTFDGASSADNSTIYFDYVLTNEGNYESEQMGITAKCVGGFGLTCDKSLGGLVFSIETLTDDNLRQTKLWKRSEATQNAWVAEPNFMVW